MHLNFLCQHHGGQFLIGTSSKKREKNSVWRNYGQCSIWQNREKAYIFHVKIH